MRGIYHARYNPRPMGRKQSIQGSAAKVKDRLWWIPLAALFVSFCALVLSLHSGYEDRRHKRLSVHPNIGISFYFNDRGAGWRTVNNGLGPAVVKWFAFYVDGKPQTSWNTILRLLEIPRDGFSLLVPAVGQIKSVGSDSRLLWAEPGIAKDQLIKNQPRVLVEICYCSIYDDCWLVSDRIGSREPNACSPEDAKRRPSPVVDVLFSRESKK
jgi:hypothetical protein